MDIGKWVSDCLSKNKYSERIAKRVQRDVKKERGVDVRIYHCPHCGGYHLTKKSHVRNQ